MGSSLTMFISLIATSGVFTVFLCVYAYLKRAEMPGARTFMLYTGAQAIYIFSVAFEMAARSLGEVMGWTAVQYVGMAPAPALGLIVVLEYIGKAVPRRLSAALFVIPAISVVMVATNGFHHLFYKSVAFYPGDPMPVTEIAIGPFYILHGIFTFGSMLAGVVLLLRRWRHTKKAYRIQLATLIVGQFMPMAGAFAYLVGLIPYGADPVPLILCVTSAMYIWAILSTRMLTIVPIAKESIFESMGDGVIVLDNAARLIDFNGAARRMLPGLGPAMIGLTLDEAWNVLSGADFPAARLADGLQEEVMWRATGGEPFYYQIRSSVVRGRVGGAIGSLLMLIDVTEQRRLQDQLQQLAYHDGLTKLLNRTAFIHRAKERLAAAKANGASASIVLFDIDHFKRINDTYGHETGDCAIRHVAAVVKRQLGADALFARYGGEEFVLCLPASPLAEAAETAERIRAALAAEPLRADGLAIAVTASFGAAEARPAGEPLQALLKQADLALYEAKRAGRNRVRLHEPAAALNA
ncbi:diguanylate cyclase (GGDEF) domain-containing protein [Paenibacillus sp. UNC496MF]|uniref:histidine kinase N-terminal 7TM domain-containing diguanylate cyclase n=1 Tax=Paenibacillus sp. UNC496MF TaxID=1502753 RepID=UPI0008F23635|nr:histidine kinase N-terminal 7TM domain-containing protein [Paenibacillus sp. UNC496MF]SFI31480.1 diguanylate cyclase (GGDEF) domain-containing protein [Paenibacillus sp. UNC496MF]